MSECYFTVEEARKAVKLEDELYGNKSRYYDACREIIRLNEVIEGLEKELEGERIDYDHQWIPHNHTFLCPKCKARTMDEIRPGKWQCPECE